MRFPALLSGVNFDIIEVTWGLLLSTAGISATLGTLLAVNELNSNSHVTQGTQLPYVKGFFHPKEVSWRGGIAQW